MVRGEKGDARKKGNPYRCIHSVQQPPTVSLSLMTRRRSKYINVHHLLHPLAQYLRNNSFLHLLKFFLPLFEHEVTSLLDDGQRKDDAHV